jgi:2-polyprenyl-6-methoxyphenol hydroxylase-like FAD-dependent oxidoreductase
MNIPVLIVGAGPTGLTLAIDLGLRGIACTLIEQKDAPQFLPKMERCNARTMEIYGRMGLAEKIRAAGLPRHCPMDVFIVLSLIEPPLFREKHPSVAEYQELIARSTDGSRPLEPYQLVSQYTLEPLLKSVAETLPNVTVRYGVEFVSFKQDANAVTAKVKDASGNLSEITAQYMVGCDGGTSNVRRGLGIKLSGEGDLLKLRQALYYCEDLYERIPIGKGRHYHIADDKAGFLIVQDSTKHFTLHAITDNDADMAPLFEQAVAMPMKYEMLYVGAWNQKLLLADRYQDGRVFLAGDAVHLVIPTGGLGMNTGVGDAIDLSWKLAATLQGWGGPNLLASYEAERRQVGARNVAASTFASRGRNAWRAMWKPNIRDNTPEGQHTRDELVRVATSEQSKGNRMTGAELGYRYEASPLIADEPGGPEHNFMDYVPTTWPGTRLPHVWRDDHTAVQDHIGNALTYTLLRLGGTQADIAGITRAFAARGAPLQVIDMPDERVREVYGYDLLLLRPDMHVVWRGNAPPPDPETLVRTVTGT